MLTFKVHLVKNRDRIICHAVCARLLGLVFSLSFSKLLKMFHKMLWRLLILQNSSCKLISSTMKLGLLVAGRICWVVSRAHRLRFLWWDPTKKGCFNERCNLIFLSFITFSTLNDPISLFLCQINQLKSFGIISHEPLCPFLVGSQTILCGWHRLAHPTYSKSSLVKFYIFYNFFDKPDEKSTSVSDLELKFVGHFIGCML